MNTVDIIAKKRDGGELSTEEICYFVSGVTSGIVPDYQAAAWLMAVFLRGMSRKETLDLTMAMRDSGERIDLGDLVNGPALDKHSTGGVGDKTSLVVIPILAAAGVSILKMSGRGLGFFSPPAIGILTGLIVALAVTIIAPRRSAQTPAALGGDRTQGSIQT